MQKPPRRFKNPSEAMYCYLLKILSHISLQKVELCCRFIYKLLKINNIQIIQY